MTASPWPRRRGRYLPAAALLCRRDALGAGFDESMRVGEDVDLVWRVAGAGHPVRYEPRVVVEHETRPGFARWFAQRFGYGRSGAALAARHPDRLAPVVISRWSAPALLCLAARPAGPGRRLHGADRGRPVDPAAGRPRAGRGVGPG